jgi:hypothetical protein
MIDNIVKPIILTGSAQIHMMLGFLSIMGGLIAFGPKGLIVGPVVLSLVLSPTGSTATTSCAGARRRGWGDDHGRAAAASERSPRRVRPAPEPATLADATDRRVRANLLSILSAAHRASPCAKACPRAREAVIVLPTVAKRRGP